MNPDLEVARRLVEAGIPLFVAPPAPITARNKIGFVLPDGWQRSVPDLAVVDRWQPGWALCAVGGHGLDFVDIDPRHGGADSYAGLEKDVAPFSYGWVATPSSGFHSYVASLGVRSLNGTFPGIDVKAGDMWGEGRGFVFLPPTERASKVDGVARPYTWHVPLDLEGWASKREGDCTGALLAETVRRQHSTRLKVPTGGSQKWQDFLTERAPVALSTGLRTIERLLGELAGWTPTNNYGKPNYRDMLRDVAYTVGGYVAGGALDRDEAHVRLVSAVEGYYPVPNDDDLNWIAQGLDDGGDRPFPVYTPEDELLHGERGGEGVGEDGDGGVGAGGGGGGWTVYTAIGMDPFDPLGATDQDMAEQVIERMHPALRHAADASTWVVRDLERWRESPDASGWAVSTVARLMPLGDPNLPKKKEDYLAEHHTAVRRTRFMTSGPSSSIERKLKSLVSVKGHPGAIILGDLDAHPEILWAGGQPYDLRGSAEAPKVSTRVSPATPHLHTALCRPEARETPLWDRFLRAVWPDEAERSWALRVLSIALTGYSDAALPVLWGEERNGKTSVVEFLLDVLGTYGVTADPKLLAGIDSAHGSIVYALKGTRMAFIDEGPRRGHLATERLKQLTGGGRLTGNAMRTNPVTFKTTHTLIMTSNDAPPMTDPALRARIRAIHCTGNQFQVRATRRALTPEVWRREAPGVLYQMMLEAAAWLADRDSALTENAPKSFRDMEDEVAHGQDPVREWVSDCTIPTEPGTPGRQLYKAFCSWHEGQSIYRKTPVPTETSFGRTLTDMGYPASKPMEGPGGRARYRSLSVFGGPAGWVPGPMGGATGADTLPTGSGVQPVGPDLPSSDPVSSSFLTGTTGLNSTTSNTTEKYTQKSYTDTSPRGNTGHEPDLCGSIPPNASPPATSDPDGNLSPNLSRVQELLEETQTPLPPAPPAPPSQPVVSGGLTKEAAEVARLADEKKISKLEARKQLKEELIREAVTGAEGPHAQLPAAVDRQGRVLACTEDIARQLLDPVIEAGALTVDVETTGYPIGHVHYRLKTVQLGGEAVAVVLDPIEQAELIGEYLGKATKLHAHSASADLVPLAVAGLLDYDAGWAKMHDTVIPAKLGDPQSTGSDPGLKKLSAAVLGDQAVAPAADEGREALFKAGKWLTNVKPHHPVEKSGWANVNPRSAVMLRYAASDVLDTAALAKRLPPVRSDIEARERVAEEMTARIAYRGFKIDHERVKALTTEHSALQAQFGAQVREFGIENPGSAQQVAVRLAQMGAVLPLTPGGSPSVAEHVLSVLRRSEGEKAVLAGAVLDYRHSSTVLGLFLAPYAQLCDLGDSRARPTVYTMGADTGRMTCTRPNAQQLPRAGGIRSIYTADPGMVFISADFSGVELRGAAALSQDPDMIRMISEEDAGRFDGFHWQIARQAYGPDASKSDRYTAKRGVFGCVPLDTEILTQRGWLTHDQVKVGDKTPGRASDGTIRWTPVTGVHVYEDAPLMKIHGGQTWNATTTPGHRWAATRRRDGGAQGRYFVDEWTTTETISPEHTVHLGGLLDAPGTLDVSPDEAALIGWAITDGSVGFAPITGRTAQGTDGRRRKAMVKLYQSKPEGVTTIRKLLGALGLAAGERELPVAHKRTMLGHVWLLPAAPMRELFGRAKLLTDAGFDRGQLEAFVLGLSTTARLAFLEAVIAAEGHGSTISQNEGPTCDAIELAAYLCGYYVTRSVNDRRGNAVNYKLRLCTPKVTGQKLRREDAGHAPVWCVSTGLGTWTMRHSGQIMLTGNTFYGGGAAGLSKQIGVTEQEMFVIIDSLKSIAPGYFRWADGVRAAVRNGSTQFPSCSGRIIHLDQSTPHKAPAYCIQGSCRELLIDALLRWRDTRWGNTTVLPIHDELIAMVPADEAHDATLELVRCMESSLYGVEIKADPGKFDDEANQRFTGSTFWRDAE